MLNHMGEELGFAFGVNLWGHGAGHFFGDEHKAMRARRNSLCSMAVRNSGKPREGKSCGGSGLQILERRAPARPCGGGFPILNESMAFMKIWFRAYAYRRYDDQA